MRRYKSLVFIMWVAALCCVSVTYGTELPARTEQGVTVYDYVTSEEVGRRIEFYTAFDPASTSFIYNEAGGQTSSSGSVVIEGMSRGGTVQISVPTLGSTSLTVNVEGRNKKSGTWALVFSKIHTAASTEDFIVNVLEDIDQVRVGVKIATDGTDSVSIYGKFKRYIQGGR